VQKLGSSVPRRKTFCGISEVPEDGDKRWEEWSYPLRKVLQRPRTWAQLTEWASKSKFPAFRMRHCLAWLENRNLAGSKWGPDGKVVWLGLLLGGSDDVPNGHVAKEGSECPEGDGRLPEPDDQHPDGAGDTGEGDDPP